MVRKKIVKNIQLGTFIAFLGKKFLWIFSKKQTSSETFKFFPWLFFILQDCSYNWLHWMYVVHFIIPFYNPKKSHCIKSNDCQKTQSQNLVIFAKKIFWVQFNFCFRTYTFKIFSEKNHGHFRLKIKRKSQRRS